MMGVRTSAAPMWDAVSGGASTASLHERSMLLRWHSFTQLPNWSKVLTMPPIEAGVWSEQSVSGMVHTLVWIACEATSLNAAFVNGRPARPIK